MNIWLTYVVRGYPEKADPELAGIINAALGKPLKQLIRESIFQVEQATGLKADWEGLNVRCYRTTERKVGFCFKDVKHGDILPDVVLGFCGDVIDFILTLLHELLHLVRWDEKILDKKAWEVYNHYDRGL